MKEKEKLSVESDIQQPCHAHCRGRHNIRLLRMRMVASQGNEITSYLQAVTLQYDNALKEEGEYILLESGCDTMADFCDRQEYRTPVLSVELQKDCQKEII
ncbi:hypothetical protein CEXT_471421 [Caerostris extrusa]|uniref:Uncharacterized protein n=1 Tax=Caerostris extrusa TaxID=172846 RepID=A0AAV4U2D7_CAEEX|nr:hypothetical protein CEXT_471421 [Caerostris extrusa]